MVDLTPPAPRPRPILDAIRSGAWMPVLGALSTAAVTFGFLTAEQGSALQVLAGVVAGLITASTAVLSSFHVLVKAEPLVTPVEDPQDNLGRRLVPAPPTLNIT